MIAIQVNVIPDLPNTIPVIVSAIVLYFIFKHFFWKKVKDMLDKRADLVASNLRESEESKEASIALKQKYEQKLQEAKNEASEIISNARAYSEDLKAKAVKESKEEAKKEYDKGVKALELERKKVLTSVNDEIVDMAILAASKIIAEKSNPQIDREMVKAFVSNMEEADE